MSWEWTGGIHCQPQCKPKIFPPGSWVYGCSHLLVFISRNRCLASVFSPSYNQILIFAEWRIAAPHANMWTPEPMSKYFAISSNVLLHLSASRLCCCVSVMVSSCKIPASKQYVLNCSERTSSALCCLNFFGVPTLTKFLQAVQCVTLCLKQVHNTNFSYRSAKHNLEPKTWWKLYFHWSHHVCEHPLQLLLKRFNHLWHLTAL